MSINESDFKLINKILPTVFSGKYKLNATQKVEMSGKIKDTFNASLEYVISRSIFKLDANSIFTTFPLDASKGDFANVLPFITFSERTYLWSFSKTPFLCLIVLSEDEIINKEYVKVRDIFKSPTNTYFPSKDKFPSIYADNLDDECHVIDISKSTFLEIFPKKEDVELLSHAKFVDLSKSPDDVCATDGYFSVSIANRFVPSKPNEEVISYCHLVSTFGYLEDIQTSCENIRLVSLYSFSLCSKTKTGTPFNKLIEGLEQNTCTIGDGRKASHKDIKKHYTRTGEVTYSIYSSPLISHKSINIENLEKAQTADGRLLYDKDIGILNVSYASAFQLGRLITLSRPEIASKIMEYRNERKLKEHVESLKSMGSVDIRKIGHSLLEILKKEDETN